MEWHWTLGWIPSLCLPWPRRAGTCPGWPGGWWSSPCPGPGPPSPPPSVSAPPRESLGLVLVLSEARGVRRSRLKHGKVLVKFEWCAHPRLKYLFLLYFIICNLSRKLYSKSDKRNLLTREFIKYVNLTAMQRKFQEIFKYNLYIYWNFQFSAMNYLWQSLIWYQPRLEIKVKSFENNRDQSQLMSLMSGIKFRMEIKRINLFLICAHKKCRD